MNKSLLLLPLIALSLLSASCRKAYDVPEYKEVLNHETAFVLPLEGDTTGQAKFDSSKFLDEKKVSGKRIQITHRWNQTGRMGWTGTWIPNVRVITVSRAPVSKTYTAEGKGSNKDTSDDIWVESRDSVGFSIGWTVTAEIAEEDTALFLYKYTGDSLVDVMAEEIHDRIQARAAEFAAMDNMDTLREQKAAMLQFVKNGAATVIINEKPQQIGAPEEGLVKYFKTRGITITNVGMFGGFTYESQAVQAAIDGVFVSQQKEETAKANFKAQQENNKVIELAAEAEANALLTVANGKAKAIEVELKALEKAQNSPAYVEKLRIDKWDGAYPQYYMGGSGKTGLLLNVPAPK